MNCPWCSLTTKVDLLLEQLTTMVTTQAQLDTALSTLANNVSVLVNTLSGFIRDYKANTGTDLTAELASVTDAANQLQAAVTSITTTDPSA